MQPVATRRAWLRGAVGAGVGSLAGCTGDDWGRSESAPASSEMATGAVSTADGRFVAIASAEPSGGPNDALVVGFGPKGERWRLWHDPDGNTMPVSMTRAADGDLVVVGYRDPPRGGRHGWLLRVGPDGTQRWHRTYGTDYEGNWVLDDVVPFGESGLLAVGGATGDGPFETPVHTEGKRGFSEVTAGLLMGLYADGRPKWYTRTPNVRTTHALPDEHGGAHLAGQTPNDRVSSPAAYSLWLGKLGDGNEDPAGEDHPPSNGDYLEAAGRPVSITPHPAGGIAFVETGGDVRVGHTSRTESSPDALFGHAYDWASVDRRTSVGPFEGEARTLFDIASGEGGVLAVGGILEGDSDPRENPEEATPYGVLAMLSPTGDVRWSDVLRDEGVGFFVRAEPVADGFLCVGAKSPGETGTHAWGVHVDGDGTVSEEWTVDRQPPD